MNPRLDLFGMRLDKIDLHAAVNEALKASSKKASLIVTPNLDHLQRFLKDAQFRHIYERAVLVLPDGMPIVWLIRLLRGEVITRVTGVDFFKACVVAAEKNGIDIALIGGSKQSVELAATMLKIHHPGLGPIFTCSPSAEELEDPIFLNNLCRSLANSRPKIVALCLGSPKQEMLFSRAFESSGIVGVFIGAGATVDFVAELVPRSPLFLQRVGLEWIFRLMLEPRRLFPRYSRNVATLFRLMLRAVFLRIQGRK